MDIAFYVCTPMYMRFYVCTHIYKAVYTLRATPLCTVPVTQKEERLTKGLTWKERLASLGEELVVANLLLAWSKKLEDSREPVLLSKPVLPGEHLSLYSAGWGRGSPALRLLLSLSSAAHPHP
jgi:hypothetical protein